MASCYLAFPEAPQFSSQATFIRETSYGMKLNKDEKKVIQFSYEGFLILYFLIIFGIYVLILFNFFIFLFKDRVNLGRFDNSIYLFLSYSSLSYVT